MAFFEEILVVHLGYFKSYASRPRSFNYADLLETHFPGDLISNVGFCLRECIFNSDLIASYPTLSIVILESEWSFNCKLGSILVYLQLPLFK